MVLNIYVSSPVHHFYLFLLHQETTEERVLQESPYLLFYEMNGLNQYSDLFRARKGGKKQDIGSTEDDRAYEETLRNLSKKCCIQ